MKKEELARIRSVLGKTQKEFSQMLGSSLKAIQSFEQGWRKIPAYIERQALLLISLKHQHATSKEPCWERSACPQAIRQACPVWELQAGYLCWFITGAICGGQLQPKWHTKIATCRQCAVFRYLFQESLNPEKTP